MLQLRIRRRAALEIAEAYGWYFSRSQRAAQGFDEALHEVLELIQAAPTRSRLVSGEMRRVLLRGFPYAVYYKLFARTISVLGVIHGHRHPDAWRSRE